MKTGYDQFFKEIRKQSTGTKKNFQLKMEKPNPRPPAKVTVQSRRKRSSFPWTLALMLVFGIGLSIWGFGFWGMNNGTTAAMVISDLIEGKENSFKEIFDPLRFKSKL